MADLSTRLAALSADQRVRFDRLMSEQAPAENAFPISVMQQGIWFLEQLKPDNPAYVIPAAVRLCGPLDTAVLRSAVEATIRRHESLRTTFHVRDGKPMQVVSESLALELPEVDLRAVVLRPGDLEQRITEALGGPFDLAAGPLLRLTLLRLDVEEYVLVVAMHHLISDGWSVGILVAELSELYQAFLAGRPSPLPELKIQYGDFAVWQQDWLAQEGLKSDLTYWREHLAGAPAALTLTTDRARPAVQGFHGGSLPFELAAPAVQALVALAKRHGATGYMALLATFQILLHRYSTQDEIVVGVPMANRGQAEVEPLIGFFVNTLPVRTDLSGEPSFLDVLARVRTGCLGAYAHQAVPFEKLVAALKPDRDLSRSPVFQASLSYQSDPLPTRAMGGLALSRLPLQSPGARFDLELQLLDREGGLGGWLEYDRDLFDESTIARLADHFRRLVELVVAAPETAVDRLPLLDDAERHRLLVEVNATKRSWPEAGWVHESVQGWAERAPELEAVRFEGVGLSFGELNRKANQLAHRLRAAGVGRDVVVGICLERSFELVISVLAVLKAGGAYLPLDPGLPPARRDFMVADAAVPVVLAGLDTAAVTVDTPGVQVWSLPELAAELDHEPDHNLDVELGAEDLAYVIYTSGSTGEPKGVMNGHGAIRSRLLWMQDEYGLDPTDRVLQKTPFSFDVSVWELFWPLGCGARLVLARPDGHRDSRYLLDTIRAEGITTAHFVPSMLQAFLREPGVGECVSLRRVICSGEALPRELQDRFFAECGAELHNLYGPTEAAVDVTSWACRRDGDPGPVPIGFPIANTQLYVLDRYLEPVPVGVPGELYIGGRGVARGYVNRTALTAERFRPDPFAEDGAARLFRTGDAGRFRADGALEFLGRLDHQVKLRGFRIELGEIESALAAHPRVREAVVLAREHGPDDVRLVAYRTGDDLNSAELVAHLKAWLPSYMIPSAFVLLPALPLTSNGKIDRAALPDPGLTSREPSTSFVAPRDDLERAIAGVWQHLLGGPPVGTHDNFFELGGHSLLMFELRAALAETLGREVSIVELFQYPTVASLTEHLTRPASVDAPIHSANERATSRLRAQSQRQPAIARRQHSRNGR